MSRYILKTVRMNAGMNVTEGIFDHELIALGKLKLLAQDQDCLLAEVEWWKDKHDTQQINMAVIAQAQRDGLGWRIAIGQLESLSNSAQASRMLKNARDRLEKFLI